MSENFVRALQQRYLAEKKNLFALLPVSVQGAWAEATQAYLAAHVALVDQILQELWAHYSALNTAACLCAVGGYGRGELYPHSDVDVLLLMPEDAAPAISAQAAEFLSACWDVGFAIAASVRTVAECAAEASKDITVQTALLESRYLAGHQPLAEEQDQALMQGMDAWEFFQAKTAEMRQRHEKYKNTPYELEPNCKESPGGLRDLHILQWVAKGAGLAHAWPEFAEAGLATEKEAQELQKNWALLALIRGHLHGLAGRGEDRLVFDWQNPLAQALGYAPIVDTIDGVEHQRRASEALMRDYYWAAKAVTQLNQIILLNVQARLQPQGESAQVQPINDRFVDLGGLIEVCSDDLYERQPHAILETFYLYQTQAGVHGLSARTLRALYHAREVMDDAFRADPANHAMFMRILKAPSGITHVMRLMNQTSVLGRYLWVFRHTVGLMQHDLMHVYTVDQHILMVLRNVRRFFLPEHAHEYPFCSQLAAQWQQPWILWVAALFHDVAKGRGGDHSQLGAKEVETFCAQHGIDAATQDLIIFLVREHLCFSAVAQKKDLSDPQVIADFAASMQNERRLTGLYLLTVADIRGTSPKVWTAWKARLLEELYRRTLRVLGGAALDPDTEIEGRKRQALQALASYALPFDAQKRLWDTLDVGYFMRHEASEIAWHTRVLSKVMAQHPYFQKKTGEAELAEAPKCVFARVSPAGEGLQVMVYAPDQADLFLRICAFFDAHGYSILDAKIYTAPNGWVLDTFEVLSQDLPEHYRELLSMVEADLSHDLTQMHELPAPRAGRASRRARHFSFPPHVSLQGDESGQHWMLEVACADRPGLLYRIARVLAQHRLSVQSAKIVTLGERVEDSFVISGGKLQDAAQRSRVETDVLQAVSLQA